MWNRFGRIGWHMAKKITLLAGSSNIELAKEVSKFIGVPLTPISTKKFNDGESYVHIEQSVRGSTVFVIQPTSPQVNDNLMELLLIIDALKRASATEINAVIPYYGYSRQDRKTMPREPISARLVANLIEKAGADRVVTFDLHADQIQGFFDIPVDNLEVTSLFAEYILDHGYKDIIIVAPDVGGAKRARRLGRLLDAGIAIIDKRRPAHNEAEVLNIVGDVQGMHAIILDDIIDTAGTISSAAKVLKERGAKAVSLFATHAVFSGPAHKRLDQPFIKEVVVTNSIIISPDKRFSKLKIVSLSPILSETINTIFEGRPMGVIFDKLAENVEAKKKHSDGRKR